MKKRLVKQIMIDEVKFEGVEKEKDAERNEREKSTIESAIELEKENEKSKSELILSKDVRSYVSSNDLNSTLFSVNGLLQVE